MLQQTQVKTVVPYFEMWMRALPTVADFARARPERILKLWEGLGYYRRVHLAQAAAKVIVAQHGGRFPSTFDDVLALPGVGRYTAGAICSIAFDQPTPILDGNVIRVLSRVFGITGDPKAKDVNTKFWSAAEAMVKASTHPSHLNQSMMELGALVCLPRQPRCAECPLRGHCFAFAKNRVEDFPSLTARIAITQRRFVALVVHDGERTLVQRRPAGVVNAGLWEFPSFEVAADAKDVSPLVAPFELAEDAPFFRIRHSITRYRILLEAYRAQLPAGFAYAMEGHSWTTKAKLKTLPFTGAHRKVLTSVFGRQGGSGIGANLRSDNENLPKGS